MIGNTLRQLDGGGVGKCAGADLGKGEARGLGRYEAKENDNGDGGPPRGGEMVIALSPELIAGPGWPEHVEAFMDRLTSLKGVRVPGARRHKNRLDIGPRKINEALVETIRGLL